MGERLVYATIMEAAEAGRGVHLTAEEVLRMQFDDAIASRAMFEIGDEISAAMCDGALSWAAARRRAEAPTRANNPPRRPTMAEDRKFKFEDGRFVNRVSGEPIPDDEPVIIFRARDNHSIAVLLAYLDMVSDPHHRQAVMDRLDEFSAYRAAHPERLKEPGITRHIVLNKDDQSPEETKP